MVLAPAVLEKLPPSNVEAEQAVLGALLLDRDALVKISDFLRPDDFFRDSHQRVYGATLALLARNEPVDIVTVADELERRDELSVAGGLAYIHSLATVVPTAIHVEYYATIVRRTSLKRRLLSVAGRIGSLAYDDGLESDDAIAQGVELLAQLTRSSHANDVGIYSISDISEALHARYEAGMQPGVGTGWPSLDRLYRVRKGEWTVVSGYPQAGKALALDTLLPTPTGWTTMGDVSVGDQLLDDHGHVCRVTRATAVMLGRPCYRVTFSDGTVIVADAEHQWLTRDEAARQSATHARLSDRLADRPLRPHGVDQRDKRVYPSVKTTAQIAATLTVDGGRRRNHAVAVVEPLALRVSTPLPVPPYVLGAWLGDGRSEDGGLCAAEAEMIDLVEACGEVTTKWASKYAYNVVGLRTRLRSLGLLRNKHIPESYLRAGPADRLALLQGLMDTDGWVNPGSAQVEFTNTNVRLAEGVHELACTLGMKPTLSEGRALLNGNDCGPKYRVRFSATQCVFRLARKAALYQRPCKSTAYRTIVSCEPTETVPVKCLEVDSPSHLFLASRAFIPTHNSQWVDALVVNLARTHDWRFAVCSPENQPLDRHAAKWVQLVTEKPFRDGPTPRLDVYELVDAEAWLDEHFRFILPDEDALTIDGVLRLARVEHQRRPIDGLVIDPWNEFDHKRDRGQREDEYISDTLRKLRQFARRQNVHVWLVAHPTKVDRRDRLEDGSYPVPTLYDISGGAMWRNKTDFGVIVHRNVANPHDQRVQVHVQKVRFDENGEIGVAELLFDRVTGCYYERAA